MPEPVINIDDLLDSVTLQLKKEVAMLRQRIEYQESTIKSQYTQIEALRLQITKGWDSWTGKVESYLDQGYIQGVKYPAVCYKITQYQSFGSQALEFQGRTLLEAMNSADMYQRLINKPITGPEPITTEEVERTHADV